MSVDSAKKARRLAGRPAKRAEPASGTGEGGRPRGFFQRVYEIVAVIPAGKVMTYGQIAKCLGGFYSGRTVGFAMRAAPAERNLPCHRVVNKKGEMAPGHCFGGTANQRRLLRREGVKFLAGGGIDMKRYQWER